MKMAMAMAREMERGGETEIAEGMEIERTRNVQKCKFGIPAPIY